MLRPSPPSDRDVSCCQDLDAKIADAQAPIEMLEREHKELERELNTRIAQAQKASQDLNMNADKLENVNKWLAK